MSRIIFSFALACRVILGLALLASLPTPSSASDSPAELKKLRALLVLDTGSEGLSDSIRLDLRHITALLKANIPEDRLKIDVLSGNQVTLAEIRKHYRQLSTNQDEALLFYYAGHGGVNKKDKEHYYFTPTVRGKSLEESQVSRQAVRDLMIATKAGLVVLLTDCCSTRYRLPPPRMFTKGPKEARFHPVLRCLFFQHRGVVDITAARKGEGAVCDATNGGFFTLALAEVLSSHLEKVDKNRDQFVAWKEFFDVLKHETRKNFEKALAKATPRDRAQLAGQPTQEPDLLHDSTRRIGASAARELAVISLRNDTGDLFPFRYRWSGQLEWKKEHLERNKQTVLWTEVKPGVPLPRLEIESIKDKEKGELAARKWRGLGEPSFSDGELFRIADDTARRDLNEKTYAVVTLVNKTGKRFRYQFRWSGETTWQAAELLKDGQVVINKELPASSNEDSTPGLEIKEEGEEEATLLKPRRWSGPRSPGPKDGREIQISDEP